MIAMNSLFNETFVIGHIALNPWHFLIVPSPRGHVVTGILGWSLLNPEDVLMIFDVQNTRIWSVNLPTPNPGIESSDSTEDLTCCPC